MPAELSKTIKAFFETSYANAPTIFPFDGNHKALHREWQKNSQPLYSRAWYQESLPRAMVPMADMPQLEKDAAAIDSVIQGTFRPTPNEHLSSDDFRESFESLHNNLDRYRQQVTHWLLETTVSRDGNAMQSLLSAIDRHNILVLLDVDALQKCLSTREADADHSWWLEQFAVYLNHQPDSAQIFQNLPSTTRARDPQHDVTLSLGINAFFQQASLAMANRDKSQFRAESLFFYQFLKDIKALEVPSAIKRDLIKGSLVVDNSKRSSAFYQEPYDSGYELERNQSSPDLRDLLLSGELRDFYNTCNAYGRAFPCLDIGSQTDFERCNIVTAYLPRLTGFMRKIDGDSVDLTRSNNQNEHWDLKALMMSAYVNGTPILQDVLDNPKSYAGLTKPVISRKDAETAPWYDALIRDNKAYLRLSKEATRPALAQSMLAFRIYPLDLWERDPQWHQPVLINGCETTYLKEILRHYATKLDWTQDAMAISNYLPQRKSVPEGGMKEQAVKHYYKLPYDDFMPTLSQLLNLQLDADATWLVDNGQAIANQAICARFLPYMPAKLAPTDKQAWLEVLDKFRYADGAVAKDVWLTLLSQPCVPSNHKQLLRWGRTLGLSDHAITQQVLEAREAAKGRSDFVLTESGLEFDKFMDERTEKMLQSRTKCASSNTYSTPMQDVIYNSL